MSFLHLRLNQRMSVHNVWLMPWKNFFESLIFTDAVLVSYLSPRHNVADGWAGGGWNTKVRSDMGRLEVVCEVSQSFEIISGAGVARYNLAK